MSLNLLQLDDHDPLIRRSPLNRYTKLEEGNAQSLITAVMVGEISHHAINISDLEQWFPWSFLRLLSLATGTKIESPWIEFRDEKGDLVRRIHHHFSLPEIAQKRHIILREWEIPRDPDTGIGALLTQAQSSSYFGQPHLSVLLEYILSGGPSTRILEDRMAYLCRGLDGLCKHYGVDTQDYRQGLDNSYLNNVNMVLSSAAQEILNLADAAVSNGDRNQSNILKRIADRTKQSPIGRDKAFGLAIVDLLKLPQFNLHDADVVSCYYPCANRRDWPGTLSYYRGVVLHEGAFYSSKGTHNLKDVAVVMDHLHDIMVRIAFKIFGYKGAYQPTVIKGTASESVDWIDPTCLPSRLGYK